MIKLDRPPCPNPTALQGNYKFPENKQILMMASFGKCMYCESAVSHTYYWDVEHIKPKSLFPHLEFEWTNLWYVCAKCNNTKRDKYNETTAFIDPYTEDPEEHIVAVWALLFEKQWSERWELTIHPQLWIDLNRTELIEKRQDRIELIQKAINSCFRTQDTQLRGLALEDLKNEFGKDKEYSLCIKMLFKSHELI